MGLKNNEFHCVVFIYHFTYFAHIHALYHFLFFKIKLRYYLPAEGFKDFFRRVICFLLCASRYLYIPLHFF